MTQQALSRRVGYGFQERFSRWRFTGLSVRAATVLALWSCDSVADVRRLGRDHFARQANVGPKTLDELNRLAFWLPPTNTPLAAISASLALTISDPEERRDAAMDALHGLRCAGFVVVASAPSGRRTVVGGVPSQQRQPTSTESASDVSASKS